MKTRFLCGALAIATLLAALQTATAGSYHTYVERAAASGIPTHIWSFYNCVGRVHWPFMGSAFAEHGVVAFRQVSGRRCGAADVPIREVWYTSPAGFTGVDRLTFPRRRGHAEIVAVIVH